jgi:hypothetical protein
MSHVQALHFWPFGRGLLEFSMRDRDHPRDLDFDKGTSRYEPMARTVHI